MTYEPCLVSSVKCVVTEVMLLMYTLSVYYSLLKCITTHLLTLTPGFNSLLFRVFFFFFFSPPLRRCHEVGGGGGRGGGRGKGGEKVQTREREREGGSRKGGRETKRLLFVDIVTIIQK